MHKQHLNKRSSLLVQMIYLLAKVYYEHGASTSFCCIHVVSCMYILWHDIVFYIIKSCPYKDQYTKCIDA